MQYCWRETVQVFLVIHDKNSSNELTVTSRLNGVKEKAQNSIIIVTELSETAISFTTWLLLVLCITSASLE